VRVSVFVVLLLALASCKMFDVSEQQEKLDAACRIAGTVSVERTAPAPIVVVLGRQAGADPTRLESWQVADHFVLEGPGQWEFRASAGSYGLVAFQDLNRDLKYQPGEPYLRLEANRTLNCKAGEESGNHVLLIPANGRARAAETLDISALQVRTLQDQATLSLSEVTALGERATLSDARFAEAIAEDGLWRPFDFLFKGRPGVYFLEAYDSKKIPVLFVHGINGTPANFRALIGRLDRQRFQPWVYYYPSGASLAMVADHLAQTMRKLQLRYGFKSFAVVAHSMGGLVSRGFLQRYREGGAAAVPLFVSISTPWGGHRAAELGVKTAPEVVRVWVDMSPGSEYLRSLYARDPGVPHYLFYTYRSAGIGLREANDGTVTVASELEPGVQSGAVRVEGFNETHMSVLESEPMSRQLNELLARISAP